VVVGRRRAGRRLMLTSRSKPL